MLSPEEIRYGFWGARRRAGILPPPITQVDEYSGEDMLAVGYARIGQSASERKKILKGWCDTLPGLRIKVLEFYAGHQDLFDAATQIQGLEALSTGWGSIKTIRSIARCKSLTALNIDSRPSLTGLAYLAHLPNITSLCITNVIEAHDLSFLSELHSLEELGICGSLWTTQKVDSLWPLKGLNNLQVLHLFSTRILKDGLLPLHHLKKLVNLECSLSYSREEFQSARQALPNLKFGTPIDYDNISKEE